MLGFSENILDTYSWSTNTEVYRGVTHIHSNHLEVPFLWQLVPSPPHTSHNGRGGDPKHATR